MKTYTFKVVIREGNDEFWEGIKGHGIEEVAEEVVKALAAKGFDYEYGTDVTLMKFENKD